MTVDPRFNSHKQQTTNGKMELFPDHASLPSFRLQKGTEYCNWPLTALFLFLASALRHICCMVATSCICSAYTATQRVASSFLFLDRSIMKGEQLFIYLVEGRALRKMIESNKRITPSQIYSSCIVHRQDAFTVHLGPLPKPCYGELTARQSTQPCPSRRRQAALQT